MTKARGKNKRSTEYSVAGMKSFRNKINSWNVNEIKRS